MHFITIRSLVNIENGLSEEKVKEIYPYLVLMTYIIHIVLQHCMVYMYKEECKTRKEQNIEQNSET